VNQNIANDFIELLRPATILGKIPGLRVVPFNTKVPSQTGGGSYGWVGEMKPKPLTKLAFASVALGITKVAGIVVLTEEVIRLSNPSAEKLVRDDMVAGIAQFLDAQFIDPAVAAVAGVNPASITNGAPTGGIFSDLIQRDPVTGAVLNVNAVLQNVSRRITEGLDYEASYQLDTSIFGRDNFGVFTFTFNGNYLARYVRQATPADRKLNFDNRFAGPRLGSLPRNRWYTSLFYDGPPGSWLGGLDAGATVHYIGQYWDGFKSRKIREWTTLDLIVNYTFNLPASAAQNEVAGYARDGGKNTELKDGKGKNVMPVSTAEYNPCGWRAWLNNTTITLGMNNVFDQDPPFVAGAAENVGYDQWQANIRGRIWYVALKKRF
jgi:hypothetical protein